MKKLFALIMALTLLVPTFASANATVKTPAADLRATLDHLLSEHFVLAVASMQKAYDDAEDAEHVQAALDQNAADMKTAVESIYGAEGAEQFNNIFAAHNNYTDDLVMAAKNNDEEARKAAEAEIEEFVVEFSTFLDGATGGNLPQKAAEEAIRAHEADVLNVFDSYVAGDYEAAYMAYREGFARMFDIGKALSGAIVMQMPDKFEGSQVDTPASNLRATLNKLAAEHTAYATIGMQKGFDQAEDVDFINWAEDAHTADFKAAIASIYGEEGAAQFEQVWQPNHIDAQSMIVAATLENDEAKRAEAEEHLQTFAKDFGGFLGAATEENLPSKAATEAVWAHEELVLKSYDHYTAAEYKAAYDSFRESYAFMFGIGETLGGAIVAQHPDKFGGENTSMPSEMPNTGMGGGSTNSMPTAWIAVALGAVLVAATFLVVRRKINVSDKA
ncbi:copper amine oxidase [Bacillus sp. THAF10]|uniref:copper amine oxidase n=1 Tax=Bacillus sp. THAF10 TaxID=2587848 RepID=UPI0020A6B273|nr:copper amine oxidase [Bacillus sp. THAF10]